MTTCSQDESWGSRSISFGIEIKANCVRSELDADRCMMWRLSVWDSERDGVSELALQRIWFFKPF